MRTLIGLFCFCLFALSTVANLRAQELDVSGWWVAQLEHNGEREALYLHFDTDVGHQRARFTAPRVRIYEAALGPYEVTGAEVRMTGVGWTLAIANGGAALDGTIPDGLVPVYHIPAHFERAAAPLPPSDIVAREAAPAPAWTFLLGAEVWAGLVYDPQRNLVYVADDLGRVTALDMLAGSLVWRRDLGSPIRATPTLDHGRLYVASDMGVTALEARSGRQRWSAPFGAAVSPRLPTSDPNSRSDHYSASVALDDGQAFVAGRDGCVYALRASTGARIWRTCTGSLITGTPALSRRAVFVGDFDGQARALSRRDGAELWRTDLGGAIPRDAVIDGPNVLFGSRSYDLVALNAATGSSVWTRYFWFSWVDSPPVAAEGVIYSGSSDAMAIQAFDAASGRPLWATPVAGWSWPRVGVGRDTVYAGVVGGPYLTPRVGAFAAVDRGSGVLRWIINPERPADPTSLYGFAAAPAVAGQRVFIADLAGTVFAFDDSGRYRRP